MTNSLIFNKYMMPIFSEKDFGSGDGMLTSVWGPSIWHFLHTISFNYPVNPTKEDKKHYMEFVKGLLYVLPCKFCRINLKKNFRALPLTMDTMSSRETFSRYIYNLHEHINKMLNKQSNLTYEDVRERYEHFRARCLIKTKKNREKSKKKSRKEKGCIKPLHGTKSKCVLRIIPQSSATKSFEIDKKCLVINEKDKNGKNLNK